MAETTGTIANPNPAPSPAPAPAPTDPAPAPAPVSVPDPKAADPVPAPADPVPAPEPPKSGQGDPAPKPGDPAPKDPKAAEWPAEGLPPNYRERLLAGLTGDDLTAAKNILERLNSPGDVVKKLLNQERQLSQPRKATKPGKDAKPEEIAAWRKENGVPDAPDKYDIKLPDGKILGDEDKAVMKTLAPVAVEAGITNDQMSTLTNWYLGLVEGGVSEQLTKDKEYNAKSGQELKTKWGGDYDRNINAIAVLMQDEPEGFADQLLNGRLADGRKVGDVPEVVDFLSRVALQAFPTATLLPTDMPSTPAMNTEISQIEAKMKTDIDAYFKDPVMQKRYSDLLQAREVQMARTRKT